MKHGIDVAWATVLKMIDGFFALLPNLVIAAFVFFAFYMLSRLAGKLAYETANRAHVDRTLAHAMGRLMSVFINVFGLLVCAVIVVPSFSPDKLIAGLGITSVAIGFAFQNILQNFFAGLLLLWQKPFGIGDEIKAKDYEGTVEDITIRTTLLKTFSGELVYIPNGLLFTDPVTVNTAYSSRRVQLQIPINTIPGEKAVEIARNTIANVSSISKNPPPEVYVSSSSGTPKLDIYVWTKSRKTEMIQATNEATFAIQSALLQKAAEDQTAKAA